GYFSLRGTSLCRALRAAAPCGAAPSAHVHKQRKVTRRKAKAFDFQTMPGKPVGTEVPPTEKQKQKPKQGSNVHDSALTRE
ncbi:MAG: hypothetical protein QM581_09605, partial [Pseudomonas sp.]